jgi:murein L,D-transpeptidase YafK
MTIEWFGAICSFITTILMPIMLRFMFYDSKKREAAANAQKKEAEALSQFANEWKELYEEKCQETHELKEKVDKLYDIIHDQQNTIFSFKMRVVELEHRAGIQHEEVPVESDKK